MGKELGDKKTGLRLPLENMSNRHVGLTSAIADFYVQAAQVCLDRHYSPPTVFVLQDDKEESSAVVDWLPVDIHVKNAWANDIDTTEAGAYACALAATEMLRGLVAVRRAETETGADYYVAPMNEPADDLERWMRLEVSGTDLPKSRVLSRLKVKVDQALAGKSNLPAIAAIVGFKAQLILLQSVEHPL